jgi:hypothetical protein
MPNHEDVNQVQGLAMVAVELVGDLLIGALPVDVDKQDPSLAGA